MATTKFDFRERVFYNFPDYSFRVGNRRPENEKPPYSSTVVAKLFPERPPIHGEPRIDWPLYELADGNIVAEKNLFSCFPLALKQKEEMGKGGCEEI